MSDLSKQGTEPPVDVGDSTAFVNELPSLRRNTAVGASAIAYSTFVLELIQWTFRTDETISPSLSLSLGIRDVLHEFSIPTFFQYSDRLFGESFEVSQKPLKNP